VLIDRRALSLRLVAWAALVVLLVAPESLLTASFQLSFAAVTALVAVYEFISRDGRSLAGERGPAVRIALYLAGVALTGLVATLATAPFVAYAYNFNRLALYGLLANMIAVPVMSLWIMPLGLLAFFLLPFGIEVLALYPMGLGIDLVLWVAESVAGLPAAVLRVATVPKGAIIAISLGGLWLAIWQSGWRLLGLGPLLLGLVLATRPDLPDILIGGDGRLAAVRLEDGALGVSNRRLARFEREMWMRRLGTDRSITWPDTGPGLSERMRCDVLGCLYRDGAQVVAFVFDGRALDEDCRLASILISLEPLGRVRCAGPGIVIDRLDLWREGAHADGACPAGQAAMGSLAGRGGSVTAQQTDKPALNSHAFGGKDPGLVALVGGLQGKGAAFAPKALQCGFLVIDQGHDDGPVFRRVGSLDDHRIAVENAGVDHRIALDLQRVVIALAKQRDRDVHIVVIIAQRFDRRAGGDAPV
jgi:competence protein ComEC